MHKNNLYYFAEKQRGKNENFLHLTCNHQENQKNSLNEMFEECIKDETKKRIAFVQPESNEEILISSCFNLTLS